MRAKPKLKLIEDRGYTMGNIKQAFDEKTFAEFEKCIFGQIVGIYKVKVLSTIMISRDS